MNSRERNDLLFAAEEYNVFGVPILCIFVPAPSAFQKLSCSIAMRDGRAYMLTEAQLTSFLILY